MAAFRSRRSVCQAGGPSKCIQPPRRTSPTRVNNAASGEPFRHCGLSRRSSVAGVFSMIPCIDKRCGGALCPPPIFRARQRRLSRVLNVISSCGSAAGTFAISPSLPGYSAKARRRTERLKREMARAGGRAVAARTSSSRDSAAKGAISTGPARIARGRSIRSFWRQSSPHAGACRRSTTSDRAREAAQAHGELRRRCRAAGHWRASVVPRCHARRTIRQAVRRRDRRCAPTASELDPATGSLSPSCADSQGLQHQRGDAACTCRIAARSRRRRTRSPALTPDRT